MGRVSQQLHQWGMDVEQHLVRRRKGGGEEKRRRRGGEEESR